MAHALFVSKLRNYLLFIYFNLLLYIDGFQLSVFAADIKIISGENLHGKIGVPEIDVAASVDIADAGNRVAFAVKIGGGEQRAAVQRTSVGTEAYNISPPKVTGNGTVSYN